MSEEAPESLDSAIQPFVAYLKANYPSHPPIRITAELEGGEFIRTLVPRRLLESRAEHGCSPDGCLLRWYGREYRQTTPQRGTVVRALYEAFVDGHPELDGAALLEQAGYTTGRISDIFKETDIWRDQVLSRGSVAGRFRLHPPDGEQ